MGQDSHIQWTDATWNPVTGCQKVSPGCAHCYAERLSPRVFAGQTVPQEEGASLPAFTRPRRFTDVRTHPERLDQPLRWRKPRRIFVNSMSDLFHEDVPDDFIAKVWAVMALAEQHTFQILTKRPHRMRSLLQRSLWPAMVDALADSRAGGGHLDEHMPHPLPNVWIGVSVEDQLRADERIPVLLDTPVAVRFLSCEPLLGPVDLSPYLNRPARIDEVLPRIDWIIIGGESGPKARPMDLAWARSLVEQGRAAGVPVFVKQLGRVPVVFDGVTPVGHVREDLMLHHRAGGDPDEWPPDLRVREFPAAKAGA